MLLIDPAGQTYDIGKAAVFYNGDAANDDPDTGVPLPLYWDGTGPANFVHTGITEAPIEPAANDDFSILTLPENTGSAPHKAYVSGAAPTFSLGLFANPIQLRRFSPTGSASGGTRYPRLVKEHTFWLAPLQLFLKTDPTTGIQEEVDVDYAAGAWTKDGSAFTTEDTRLFNMGVFFWRCYTERLMTRYVYDDAGKALQQLAVHVMHDFTKPDGHQLWTMGIDLAGSGIDLDGFVS